MSGTGPLPPLFTRWMRDGLPGAVPDEPKATCDSCVMCRSGQTADAPDDPVFYDPKSKCCTYLPTLWNFQVGAVLADSSPEAAEGRATVEARIAAGVGVSPLALEPTPVYNLLYDRIPQAFGRAQSMRCPHYIEEGGRCGVWRARESTCATWFCKYERGAVGRVFWQQVKQLLRVAERDVATWCVLQLDPGVEALDDLGSLTQRRPLPVTADDLDGHRPAAAVTVAWGRWAGREAAFYRAAAELAQALNWSDVRALGSPELQLRERVAREAWRRLVDDALPERLRAGAITLALHADGSALATGYSSIDPLRLAPEVLEVLPHFAGRTVTEARAAIAADLGYDIEPALIRLLVDFNVLVDAR
jgi:hypothetical protein